MNNEKIPKGSISNIYLIYVVGIFFWMIVYWIFFCACHDLLFYNDWFWLPFSFGILIQIPNLAMWYKARPYASYETEVDVIRFVERNASHVILAVSVVYIAAQLLMTGEKCPKLPAAFTYYSAFALFSAVIVISLHWIPCDKVHWLVILRHLKSVPFFYAISFFLAALVSLFTRTIK